MLDHLRLTDDTFACLANCRLVFADIRRDRYCCLGRDHTRKLIASIPEPQQCDEVRQIYDALRQSGLLADTCTNSRSTAKVDVLTPESSLLTLEAAKAVRIRPGQWLTFFQASIAASAKLRRQPLRRTVRGIENRRMANSGTDARASLPDCVTAFHRARPFYVRPYLCRFDSLALIEFLAKYKLFPLWVFGITGEPFAAHCWVQEGDCVLNDSANFVRQFTPIMAF